MDLDFTSVKTRTKSGVYFNGREPMPNRDELTSPFLCKCSNVHLWHNITTNLEINYYQNCRQIIPTLYIMYLFWPQRIIKYLLVLEAKHWYSIFIGTQHFGYIGDIAYKNRLLCSVVRYFYPKNVYTLKTYLLLYPYIVYVH